MHKYALHREVFSNEGSNSLLEVFVLVEVVQIRGERTVPSASSAHDAPLSRETIRPKIASGTVLYLDTVS